MGERETGTKRVTERYVKSNRYIVIAADNVLVNSSVSVKDMIHIDFLVGNYKLQDNILEMNEDNSALVFKQHFAPTENQIFEREIQGSVHLSKETASILYKRLGELLNK